MQELVDRAAATDGVAPLSEAFVLGLTQDRSVAVTHVVGYAVAAAGMSDTHPEAALAAYGQVDHDGVAELAVGPGHRGKGVGGALLDTLVAAGAKHAWAHGDLPAARSLAAAAGLLRVRELYLMRRTLTAEDAAPVELPEGFLARPFVPGEDDEAWVATNAAAFAGHPEQGRLTVDDLHQRMALPWFDPAGLILVEGTGRDPDAPTVAAFHWTKVDGGIGRAHGFETREAGPQEAREASHGDGRAHGPETREARHGDGRAHGPETREARHGDGEVYVLGVHPAYQGHGLAGPVTRLGLAHLAGRGLAAVHLYVDGDNVRARATYARLGFVDAGVDVRYAVPVG